MRTNYFMYYKPWTVIPMIGFFFLGITAFHEVAPASILFLGFFYLIDRWLWKFPPFSWIFVIDNFSGTYEGKQECFIRRDNQIRKVYLDIKVIIAQTGSNIVVNAFYNNHKEVSSNSHSTFCVITKTEDEQHFKIIYQYAKEGSRNLDAHFGTSIIKVIKEKRECYLEGTYYTDQQLNPTHGHYIRLKRTSRRTSHPS
ncbi:hypothetical protein [uncultured Dokdonia sp.]|uniref:Cap15 family cyclic dinucleotide receptor domain-containing protein n=1 Tax=uncultured Dokdonia sp. TaxID=575653 RepID=UPI00262C2E22|nr:hypothetical protein [uncultured Dokdonia sp.]